MTTTPTPYEILDDDTVHALHRRYLARLEKKAESAIAAAGAPQSLKGIAVDILRHGAKMRLLDMAAERLVDVLRQAAAGDSLAALSDGEKIYLTGQAEQRERKNSSYSAAEIPAKSMSDFNRAARKRTFPAAVEDAFKGKNRIYLSIKTDISSALQDQIANKLCYIPVDNKGRCGYIITDWSGGYATDLQGKQKYRIGALLRKHAPELLPQFENRTTDNLMIVISRDAADIASASTNRAWNSCTGPRSGLSAWRKMGSGIEAGMMVAYLVSNSDPDIHNPLARVLIKPFIPGGGFDLKRDLAIFFNKVMRRPVADKVWYPDYTYGIKNEMFRQAVQTFVDRNFNGAAEGRYVLDEKVYADMVWHVSRRQGVTRDS